ncbi:conjugative transposon protein TraJ [Taibaiella chishuiensis]|uniref:Conjugative transposon TraJ protein n=1 Tax=Taibaiella chishuiensis TaxID=1434707 RepID=A0A2P8D0N2_9BACT|nr:conjugative transposon protein TraJ [Taibaiella chishuiensis]PSK90780.1 conjugative transposon TraJ protein [Taibaiella chishuiensis]
MGKWMRTVLLIVVGMILPYISKAQGVAERIKSLQSVLDQLYDEMIPLCGSLIGVGKGIAAFAALWYIGSRVWKHIANAEPVDFYPLFRPFVLGFCVLNFGLILALINGIMKPTVTGTAAMMDGSNKAIEELLKIKEEKIKGSKHYEMYVGVNGSGDKDKWLRYTQGIKDNEPTPGENIFESIGSDISFAMDKAYYGFKNSVKQWMSEVLRVLYEAASLCINTLRTFQLIVLAILGPLVFGIAVFDGFQHTLTTWIAKYLNVFLWLPVCNIFGSIIGKIQENMLRLDISQVAQNGDTFFSSTDTGYLIFMIIGIIGYFTVPSVAGFIINSGGAGSLAQKVTSMSSSAVNTGTGRISSGLSNMADLKKNFNEGYTGKDSGSGMSGSVGRLIGGTGAYMSDKLSGNSSQQQKGGSKDVQES